MIVGVILDHLSITKKEVVADESLGRPGSLHDAAESRDVMYKFIMFLDNGHIEICYDSDD